MAKYEYPKYGIGPIGHMIKKNNELQLSINQVYRKALLGLEHFSHGLVFYEKNSHMHYLYVEWDEIHMNTGEISVLRCDEPYENTDDEPRTMLDRTMTYDIFDIKPYFPNEDRVKLSDDEGSTKIIGNLIRSMNKVTCLTPVGRFQVSNGLQYLVMDVPTSMNHFKKGYYRVVWWFNRFEKKQFRQSTTCHPPYENAPETGMFATRSPVRPNPIASTLIEVLAVDNENNRLEICGFDGFDKSIILGVMPYKPMKYFKKAVSLPSWLSHWPQHKSFAQAAIIDVNKPLIRGPIDMLDSYVKAKESPSINNHSQKSRKGLFEHDKIHVVNASENNLKHIDVKINKNQITVITGGSGSGKSSLAFDTIYTESQRQFMDIMGSDRNRAYDKPSVERVEGLQPAIAIEQKSLGQNPRSTVGTVTGIIDYLRMLYVTIGTRHCPECQRPIQSLSKKEITQMLKNIGHHHKVVVPSEGFDEANPTIEVIIDDHDPITLQTKDYCYHCHRVFFDMTTAMFSFNNPEHMCPKCKGLGETLIVDENLVISNRDKSILDGASKIWGNLRKHAKKPNANWMRGEVLALAYDMNIDLELPYNELPEEFKQQLLYGSNGRKVKLTYDAKGRSGIIERPAEGVINLVKRLIDNNTGGTSAMTKAVDSFLTKSECSLCHGERLAEEARLVQIEGLRYPIAASMKVDGLKLWLMGLYHSLSMRKLEKARPILDVMLPLLTKIEDVGLSYLGIDRTVPSLSGGEGQRLRLASQFGTNLTNILYVLDEPSMGLHPIDYKFLMEELSDLRDRDNTIIMVEHERDMIMMADYVIDIGPGAGKYGGEIVAEGTIEAIMANEASMTGRYLKASVGYEAMASEEIRHLDDFGTLELIGAKENNLKNIHVQLPLGRLICVTGVSGSGKSTLISKTLTPAIQRALGRTVTSCGAYEKLSIIDHRQEVKGEKEIINSIGDIIEVSQKPIGRTPRSNPATYTGVFDLIRVLFASLEAAKKRGFGKEHFSFNGKKGQCPVCKGAGKIQTTLNFMPDIWSTCHVCNGSRYLEEVLQVTYKGYSISDVLEMEISDALDLFEEEKKIHNLLQVVASVGLSYLKLGQSATTLSGGEAQRLKLATELGKGNVTNTVYVFDEPTTGLHYEDVLKLLKVLFRLREEGNTVIVIEHDLDLIAQADHIIDLGPSGGDKGGYIIATGSPRDIAKVKGSATGALLKKRME